MEFGVILDLETTGLDASSDSIIEVGLLEFAYDDDLPPAITDMYSGLEDPGSPLSEEIIGITGLNDQLLEKRQIDWPRVKQTLERASIVIAHNAAFDSGFIRRRQELQGLTLHWGCSVEHIDWRGHGFRTRALNYLAADHGFVNAFAHRALFDCATTFRLIAPYLKELIERSYERRFRILALNSPFESKDKLKSRGYRWDAQKRTWHKSLFEGELAAERDFLNAEIYAGDSAHQEVELPALS